MHNRITQSERRSAARQAEYLSLDVKPEVWGGLGEPSVRAPTGGHELLYLGCGFVVLVLFASWLVGFAMGYWWHG
jgi:hypothetical protein